ncbi:cyclin-dependent kinases regulatory subunit-like [Porites lutea]
MRFGSLDPSFRVFERSQSETSALIFKETPRKQGVRVVNACLKKMSVKQIYYSEKYYDDVFEYRHVLLPREIAKLVPKKHLMSEAEWRSLGVQQSQGWENYMKHEPEPHILLFRRERTDMATNRK